MKPIRRRRIIKRTVKSVRTIVPPPKKLTVLEKKDRATVVHSIAHTVHKCRTEASGRKGFYGNVKAIIDRNLSLFPWLTRSKVCYAENKIKCDISHLSTTLTRDSDPTLLNELIIANDSSSSLCVLDNSAVDNDISSEKAPGRPKYTTSDNKIDARKRIKDATNVVSIKYKKIKDDNTVSRGALQKLILNEELNYSLPHGTIKESTIRKRVHRGNVIVLHPGPHSPVEAMEEYLIVIVIQRARMDQPLSVTEGINLANSLIKGTPMQIDLITFKKEHKLYKKNSTKDMRAKTNRLGRSYWKLFL